MGPVTTHDEIGDVATAIDAMLDRLEVAFAAYNGARNGAELGALVLGGIVVGALGARAALLVAGLGPALIGVACLLLLVTRRRAAAAVTTNEGGVLRAHIQG